MDEHGYHRTEGGLWVAGEVPPEAVPPEAVPAPRAESPVEPRVVSPVAPPVVPLVVPPVPERVAAIREVRSEAWWVSVALALIGTSGLTGVLTVASGATKPGLADTGDAEAIVRAGFATLALTAGVFFASYLGVSGALRRMGGYGAVATVALCLLAGNLLAIAAGKFGSTAAVTSASPNGLFDYIGQVVADHVAVFGPGPVLSGAVVGFFVARWAHRLATVT